jgi:hypothetical protein
MDRRPLTAENHTVMDADQVGMQACWYGNDYGDADYKHSPLPNQGNGTTKNTTGSETDVGMHLWYASDAFTFQQLGWRNGDSNWTYQQETCRRWLLFLGSWHDNLCHDGQFPGYGGGLVEGYQYQYLVLDQPSDQPMDE